MATDGADFDHILARVGGPLGVEIWDVDAGARAHWEAYAAEHGWTAVDWFDMPGAFAWRRDPPGLWEMTWQQTAHAREMLTLRLMPPEHSLVWRHQLIALVRDLGATLGRDVELVDEAAGVPLLRFDADLDVIGPVGRRPGRALDLPPEPLCCDMMADQFAVPCTSCPDPRDCPDQILLFFPAALGDTDHTDRTAGEYGIPVRDGGSSYIAIRHCPWCGTRVPIESVGASGSAEHSSAR